MKVTRGQRGSLVTKFLESFSDAILNLELAIKHEVELHEYSRRDTMPTEDDDVKKIVQKTKIRKISIQKSIDKLEEDEEESEGELIQIFQPQYPGGVPLTEDRLVNFANQLDGSKTGKSEVEEIKFKTVEKISEVIDQTYQEASFETKDTKKYEEPDSGIQMNSHMKIEVEVKAKEDLSEDKPELEAKPEVKIETEERSEDKNVEVKILNPMYPGGAELIDKERLKTFESQLQKTGREIEKEPMNNNERNVADAIKAEVVLTKMVKYDDSIDNIPEETAKDQPKKAEIEDVKVKIMKPQFPGGAIPNADRLKHFDKQLVSDGGDSNGLKVQTEMIVVKPISNKYKFLKIAGKNVDNGM